jgi:hypothetical protein
MGVRQSHYQLVQLFCPAFNTLLLWVPDQVLLAICAHALNSARHYSANAVMQATHAVPSPSTHYSSESRYVPRHHLFRTLKHEVAYEGQEVRKPAAPVKDAVNRRQLA